MKVCGTGFGNLLSLETDSCSEHWLHFDHLYSGSERAMGLSGECEGFVIRDLYTGIVHAYPVTDKHSDHALASLLAFREA